MNAARLLALYERIAEAPDAVARLRRFVLDLAVRGKLVSQDAGDEPASELLKRIAREKARLVKLGEVRKPRELGSADEIEAPFPVPPSWKWIRLDGVGAIIGGGTPSAADAENFAEPGDGVPWLTPADLGGHTELYVSRGARDLSEKGARTSSATIMPAGTVLFTSRAPIGYVAIASNPLATNQGFKSIVPYVVECSRFIAVAMKAFAPEIDAKAPGTTFKEVSGKIVAAVPFPLAPLAEQHRIVAKVDELMALCDRLEAARTAREAARDRLAAASLARLNTPDPETFPTDARFALDALPALTTRPDQIKDLRQTILNLAVRGKLVPQDARDEPVSALIARIGTYRQHHQAGRAQTQSIRPIPEAEAPHPVPSGWAWFRFGDITVCRDGRRVPVSKEERSGRAKLYDYYGASGVIDRIDGYLFDQPLLLIGEDGANLINRSTPIAFMARGRYWVNNHAHVIDGVSEDFLRYLELFINATDLKLYVTGTAQPKMNQAKMNSIPVALPPQGEQERILARVNELMGLCGILEAGLTDATTTRTRLLEVTLTDTLAPLPEIAA
ncbi:restriction endonuclease subunit S [Roseomonas fluvialis]|uniref:Type I restriction endonuclease EcoAI subunit S n=1 Tax=Roseomonas fluvialis TaxID=1750527 RepID=A0ABM7Y7P7_9PROT|nr:restriction endonuclease subunit S [Roseomonas fluvialis]BDG74065.1 type I restriction endonuclease EcoAI subunit S [Roseomonas fluvialis]